MTMLVTIKDKAKASKYTRIHTNVYNWGTRIKAFWSFFLCLAVSVCIGSLCFVCAYADVNGYRCAARPVDVT